MTSLLDTAPCEAHERRTAMPKIASLITFRRLPGWPECRYCGCKIRRVRGTFRHYGSYTACLKIQKLEKQIRRIKSEIRSGYYDRA